MKSAEASIGADVSDVIVPLRWIKWHETAKKWPHVLVPFAAYQGRDDVVGKKIGGIKYTHSDYSQMLRDLFDRGGLCRYGLSQGAVSAMRSIGSRRLNLVTSLKKDAVGHVHTLLERCGLSVPIVSTDGRSKLPHIKSFDAFIDNDARELDEMRGMVSVRILYDMYGCTTSRTQKTPRGVERAESWPQVLRILQRHELLQKAA